MKIKLSEIKVLLEKYGSELDLILLNDIYLPAGTKVVEAKAGENFEKEYIELCEKQNINEIDIRYEEKLYAKLMSNFPSIYRQPEGRKSIVELDRIIDNLNTMNLSSKRKRNVIAMSEVYRKAQNGYEEPIIYYGEKLDNVRWNQVKVRLNRNTLIDYRVDECGILIFFPLSAGQPGYAQNFMHFTELVSMIVESRKNGIILYPDFNPETDVFTANNSAELIRIYNDNRPSLVIVGGEIDEKCKLALIQLKQFDKYAKIISIKSPDPKNKQTTLKEIQKIYNKKQWEEI